MYYYKALNKQGEYSYSSSSVPIDDERFEQIIQSEYLKAITPTEQEIREEKERQFKKLMLELYPPEEV